MLEDKLIGHGLSRREAEVASAVAKGWRSKEVANSLFVSEKTIKFHLTNIYKKLKIRSRAQLILWCMPYMNFVEKKQLSTVESTKSWEDTPIVEHGEIELPKSTV